jgi:cell division septum initiation protein DivIVA
MNQPLKLIMLEAEKKVYEQVLNNQLSHLAQDEIDELLDLILEINKQLLELKKDISK